jgi:hypothetical protein
MNMCFVVNTFKSISSDITLPNRESICMCCKCLTKFKSTDAIIIQYQNGYSNYTSMHISCFLDILKQNCPNFWKNYILGMI